MRGTFGVLVGAHQALRAELRELADAMGAIVRDETRHAALSWDVHAWAMQQLDPRARERVRARQEEAIEWLGHEVRCEHAPQLTRLAGTPGPVVQTAGDVRGLAA